MHISLTPTLDAMVREKVESGMYNNASEVIREALRMMCEQEKLKQYKLERLREEIREGSAQLDSGIYAEYSLQGLKEELDLEESTQ